MRHIGACDWEIAAHWSSLYFENGNEGYSVNVLTGHSKSIKDIHFMYSKKNESYYASIIVSEGVSSNLFFAQL